jgi:hypothetical protein
LTVKPQAVRIHFLAIGEGGCGIQARRPWGGQALRFLGGVPRIEPIFGLRPKKEKVFHMETGIKERGYR